MLGGARGDYTASEWHLRCICLLFSLFVFLLFSTGSAIPSREENGDVTQLTIDDSSDGASSLSSNYQPALQEFQVRSTSLTGHLFPGSQPHFRTGLQNLARKFIAAVVTKYQTLEFGVETMVNSWAVEVSQDYPHRQQQPLQAGLKENHRSTSKRGRRLLLRGPGLPHGRSSSHRYFWALNREHYIHNEGRNIMEEDSSSPTVGQQTQEVLMGPPAPPGLVHNEKQDWNQDYAEPDVHPPSSN